MVIDTGFIFLYPNLEVEIFFEKEGATAKGGVDFEMKIEKSS